MVSKKITSAYPQNPETIAVFRPSTKLSEILYLFSALKQLRQKFKDSKLVLITLPWVKSLLERFPNYANEYIFFPGFPGIPDLSADVTAIPGFIKEVQKKKFNYLIQMAGNDTIWNAIAKLVNANSTIGYFNEGEYCPDPSFYIKQTNEPEEIKILRLLQRMGITSKELKLEFPLLEKDHEQFDRLKNEFGLLEKNYICIHPGARFESKRWIPERFAFIADIIASKGYQIVFTGTESEYEINEYVKGNMKLDSLNVAGKTSLGSLALLFKKSRLVISNDTGAYLVAAAMNVPRVVIITNSHVNQYCENELNRAIYSESVSCRPCEYEKCPLDFRCAKSLLTGDVLAEIESVLNKKRRQNLVSMHEAIHV